MDEAITWACNSFTFDKLFFFKEHERDSGLITVPSNVVFLQVIYRSLCWANSCVSFLPGVKKLMSPFSFPSSTFLWSRSCFITHTKLQLCPLFCRKSNLSGQSSNMVVAKTKWSTGVTPRKLSHWLAGSFMTCSKTVKVDPLPLLRAFCTATQTIAVENVLVLNGKVMVGELHLHVGTALFLSFHVRGFCCRSVKVWDTHSVTVQMRMVLPGFITQQGACMQETRKLVIHRNSLKHVLRMSLFLRLPYFWRIIRCEERKDIMSVLLNYIGTHG